MKGYELLKFQAFAIVAQGTIKCSVPECPVRHLGMLHLDHIYNDGCKQRKKHSKVRRDALLPLGREASEVGAEEIANPVCQS